MIYIWFYNLYIKILHSDKKIFFLLDILAFLYKLLLLIRLKTNKSIELKQKIISVGNLTLGGSGKTECVISLAEYLINNGKKRIGIATRGYGLDEITLLKEALPEIKLAISPNRIKKIKKITDIDLFILDDGYQYIKLHRDLDILLVNCLCGFGNLRLFPRGILREPITALNRADVVILTKSDIADEKIKQEIINIIRKVNLRCSIFEAIHRPICLVDTQGKKIPLDIIKEKKILAVSSIADPKSLELILYKLGASKVINLAFPDHYVYKRKDISYLKNVYKLVKADFIITTRKDSLKLKDFSNKDKIIDFYWLKIKFCLKNHTWLDILKIKNFLL